MAPRSAASATSTATGHLPDSVGGEFRDPQLGEVFDAEHRSSRADELLPVAGS
jgi:hypothetical protein